MKKKILAGLACTAVALALLIPGCAVGRYEDSEVPGGDHVGGGENTDPPGGLIDWVDWTDISGSTGSNTDGSNADGSTDTGIGSGDNVSNGDNGSESNGSGSNGSISDDGASQPEEDDTGWTEIVPADKVAAWEELVPAYKVAEWEELVPATSIRDWTEIVPIVPEDSDAGEENETETGAGAGAGEGETAGPGEVTGSGEEEGPGDEAGSEIEGPGDEAGSQEGSQEGSDDTTVPPAGDVSDEEEAGAEGTEGTAKLPEGADVHIGVKVPDGFILNEEEWLDSFTLASSEAKLVLDTEELNAVTGDEIMIPDTAMFGNETGNHLDVKGWYFVDEEGNTGDLMHSGDTFTVTASGTIMPCFTESTATKLSWSTEGFMLDDTALKQNIAKISNGFNTNVYREELRVTTSSTKWFRLKGDETITDNAVYDVTYTVTNYDHKAITFSIGALESGYQYDGGNYFTTLDGETCQIEMTLEPGESQTVSWTYIATRPASGQRRTHFITGIESSSDNIDTDGKLHLGLIIDHSKRS